MQKGLFIKTYGCQMNVYDSERIAELLRPLGYGMVDAPDDANMIVLNTCHIREKAAEKLYSDLGRYKIMREAAKKEGRKIYIAVAGCVAQAEGDEIMRRAPVVDMVVGPQTYHQLPAMLEKIAAFENDDSNKAKNKARANFVDTDFPVSEKFDNLPTIRDNANTVTAFLTIQEGCDKFCSFCVVPYTRGAEFSRPAADIISEAKQLLNNGVREITLLGQNVNAYHGVSPNSDAKEWGLARLIYALAELDGLKRIRYTTSHPRDMDDALIGAHGEVPSLMPYLHLPIQSGSNAILKAMNRKHTRDDYLKIVEKLRHARPDIALTSDFIVGFPGESDADFIDSLKIIREVEYAAAYSFKYSIRPGTPAADKAIQVPEDMKSKRLSMLQQLLSEQQVAFNAGQIGKILPVLVEKQGRHQHQATGRSPYLQPVHMPLYPHEKLDDLIGKIIDCRVNIIKGHSLFADRLDGHMTDAFMQENRESA